MNNAEKFAEELGYIEEVEKNNNPPIEQGLISTRYANQNSELGNSIFIW